MAPAEYGAARSAALARLAGARVARLATADASAIPHVVPVCFVLAGSGIFSVIDDKPKPTRTRLRRLRNLAANPRASLLVDHYEEDWNELWFVMVEGPTTLVTSESAFVEIVAMLRAKYPQYRAMNLAFATHPMNRLAVERVVSWQAKGPVG
jgi:PPOX class probable F420-dependent enzyme